MLHQLHYIYELIFSMNELVFSQHMFIVHENCHPIMKVHEHIQISTHILWYVCVGKYLMRQFSILVSHLHVPLT